MMVYSYNVLAPTSSTSSDLIVLDTPQPLNLLDSDSDETPDPPPVTSASSLRAPAPAPAFCPLPGRTSQFSISSSIPRTPDPVLIPIDPEQIDFSSLSIHPPSPSPTVLASRPPTPLDHLLQSPSPAFLRYLSPKAHADRTPLIDYGEPHIPSRSPSPSSPTPDLTPDSSEPYSLEARELEHSSPNLSVESILISNPEEAAQLFQYDYTPHSFPTEALEEAAGDKTYKLPPELERLVDIDSDSEDEADDGDDVSYKLGGLITEDQRSSSTLMEDFPHFGTSEMAKQLKHAAEPLHAAYGAYMISEPSGRSSSDFSTPFGRERTPQYTDSLNSRSPSPQPTPVAGPSSGAARISPYQLLLSLPSPRLTIPKELIKPALSNALQITIMESWKKTEPSQKLRDYRKQFLARLTTVINARFGGGVGKGQPPRFEVDVFGSVSWGGETGKSGDLDLVVLVRKSFPVRRSADVTQDRHLPQGYHPDLWRIPPDALSTPKAPRSRLPTKIDGLPGAYHTYILRDCLQSAGMVDVLAIARANTPIVKFIDPTPGRMHCDINVNDLGGWCNSSLILHYCLLSPYLLRPMIHSLKLWAAGHSINDASGTSGPPTMSSYCLTLMAIAYLQYRGCLPNLQANVTAPVPNRPADTSDPNVIWAGWSREQGIKVHVAFDRHPPADWVSREPKLTVDEAVRGFFSFFSFTIGPVNYPRFDFQRQMLSVLQGGIVLRAQTYGREAAEEAQFNEDLKSRGWPLAAMQAEKDAWKARKDAEEEKMGKGDIGIQPRSWSAHRIVVQDPFIWQKNCAGMMAKAGLDRWQQAVDDAHRLIEMKGNGVTLKELCLDLHPPPKRKPARRGRGSKPGSGRGTPSSGRRTPGSGRSTPAGGSRGGSASSRARGSGRGRPA